VHRSVRKKIRTKKLRACRAAVNIAVQLPGSGATIYTLRAFALDRKLTSSNTPAVIQIPDGRLTVALVIEMPLEFRPPAVVTGQVRAHELGRPYIVAVDEQLLLEPGNLVTV
jgi:hypothetical protein